MENYQDVAFQQSIEQRVSVVMKRVFSKMALALVVTGLVALFCANSYGYVNFIFTNSWAMWALIIAEFGLVIGISAGINKLSTTTATLLFYLFAVVNGMTLAPIFLIYTGESIAKTFFITAGTFGAMAAYGWLTNKDLSKMGSILLMALIGLIICSIVNIFTQSTGLYWIISGAGVLIFIGLIAWDVQQIKNLAALNTDFSDGKIATLGALSLYLDFINLFLYLLKLFGRRR